MTRPRQYLCLHGRSCPLAHCAPNTVSPCCPWKMPGTRLPQDLGTCCASVCNAFPQVPTQLPPSLLPCSLEEAEARPLISQNRRWSGARPGCSCSGQGPSVDRPPRTPHGPARPARSCAVGQGSSYPDSVFPEGSDLHQGLRLPTHPCPLLPYLPQASRQLNPCNSNSIILASAFQRVT